MLAAGGLSAAVAFSSFGAEPDYFTDKGEAVASAVAEAQPLPEAAVLRWKTSRIERGSYDAARIGATTTVIAESLADRGRACLARSNWLAGGTM